MIVEAKTDFQTALKKTVVMFNTMTGKSLTEEEGSIFINLLDMTEGYQSVVTHGTAGMVISVGDDGELGVAAVSYPSMVAQHVDGGAPKDLPLEIARPVLDDVPQITNGSRAHIQGYDWQIAVLSREKDPADSYVVHFANKLTQGEFEEHFVKFIARTHYVHVNEWNGAWSDWMSITHMYEIANLSRPEQVHNPRWEQDNMAYRVRYYARETGQLTFKYMPRRPSGNELATYHHAKGFASVQSKVA